jgi:hypothetical protein
MCANAIDLTTLAAVKAWAGVTTSGDDQVIQDAITAFSLYAMHVTGRGSADGSVPTSSPFATPVSYDEFYDGNGNESLYLRNWPITAVTAVIDTGYTIPQSTSTVNPGWYIDQSHKYIGLRYGGTLYSQRGYGGAGRRTGYGRVGFSLGQQNVEVQYTAGFSAVPFDLEMTARKVVALNYKRRQRIDQKSQAMAQGAGTVSFYDWEMDSADARTMNYYQARVA